MSNKLNSFESRENEIRSSMIKPIIKPISNMIPSNKIPRDNLIQYSSNNPNGLVNKLMQKPQNLNFYKNSILEPKRSLANSKSNAHLDSMVEEDQKKAYFDLENSKKNATSKRDNSKNSAFNESEKDSNLNKNTKEAMNFGNSYNTYNPNQIRKEMQSKYLPVETNRPPVDKSIHLLNNKPNIYLTNDSNCLTVEEAERDFKNLMQTKRNNNDDKNKFDNDLYNTLSNPIIDNLNHYQHKPDVVVRKICKPTANNLSVNLVNNNNFMNSINNKNSFVHNTNRNSNIKNSFNNTNFIGANNSHFNNYNSVNNPTILKGGFIMGAMEKQTKPELLNKNETHSHNNFTMKYETHQPQIPQASKNPVMLNKQSDLTNSLKSKTNNDKNKNINNEKNDYLFLVDSRINCYQNINKTNKNRSASFNGLKYRSNSQKFNHKRPKSQTFNEKPNDSDLRKDMGLDYHSLEKKDSLENFQKKVSKLMNESNSLSILDLKKRYNEVIKKKKIPTSLLIKSIKSSVDKKIPNNTVSNNDKNINYENNVITNNTNKSILKPVASNNVNIRRNSMNFSNISNFHISELQIAKLNRQTTSISSINNFIEQNNLQIKEIADKQEHNDFLKSSNITIDQTKYDKYNGMKTVSKEKRIIAVNKNAENKIKLRNRIYNDDKFTKNLYNPKKTSSNKNKLSVNSNKNINKNSNTKELFDFKTEVENERGVSNNFDNLAANGHMNTKRLRAKNKSFANTNLNWNNFNLTNKSQNLITKNNINNKSNYRTKIRTIDSLLKFELQNMEVELKNQTTKNLNLNKKSLDMKTNNLDPNAISVNNKNAANSKPINVYNFNYNPNILSIDKNKIEGQMRMANKSSANSELINELHIHVKNQNQEANNNNDVKNNHNINAPSRLQLNRENNLQISDLNDKGRLNQNLFDNVELEALNNGLLKKNNFCEQQDDENNLIKTISATTSNQNNNIRILENDSDIILNETSRYNKLNNTDSGAQNVKSVSNLKGGFDSETSDSILENQSKIEDKKTTIQRSNLSIVEPNIQNVLNKSAKEEQMKQSKDFVNNNKSFSNCSQYADDIENMTTIIKRLNFDKNTKNEDSIFNLKSRVYIEFNLKYKSEIEPHLFPKKNSHINSVGKRNDSNSKSNISTQDTSSKKKISPNDYKNDIKEDDLNTGREKINLFNVHLSKI